MRTCLVFFLAIMLLSNSAYVAAVGVCDDLDHMSNYEHSDDHTHNNLPVNSDEAGKTFSVSDHHHDHVHPNFSYILPCIIGVMPLTGSSPMVAATADAFVSASQAPPARPPKATPA